MQDDMSSQISYKRKIITLLEEYISTDSRKIIDICAEIGLAPVSVRIATRDPDAVNRITFSKIWNFLKTKGVINGK